MSATSWTKRARLTISSPARLSRTSSRSTPTRIVSTAAVPSVGAAVGCSAGGSMSSSTRSTPSTSAAIMMAAPSAAVLRTTSTLRSSARLENSDCGGTTSITFPILPSRVSTNSALMSAMGRPAANRTRSRRSRSPPGESPGAGSGKAATVGTATESLGRAATGGAGSDGSVLAGGFGSVVGPVWPRRLTVSVRSLEDSSGWPDRRRSLQSRK